MKEQQTFQHKGERLEGQRDCIMHATYLFSRWTAALQKSKDWASRQMYVHSGEQPALAGCVWGCHKSEHPGRLLFSSGDQEK